MATIASLAVSLGFEPKEFDKGLSKALSSLSSFDAAAQGVFEGLGASPALAGNLANLAGRFVDLAVDAGRFVAAQFAVIESTGELAERLGASIEKTSELAYVAQVAGVSLQEFGNFMEKGAAKLGEARIEGGKAAEAFTQIGLSIEELARLDPTEQFIRISEAIRGFDKGLQSRLAMDIYGKKMGQMLNILKMSSAEFETLRAGALGTGNVLTETDVQEVAKSNMALRQLQAAFDGMAKQIAIEISPALTGLANALTGLSKSVLAEKGAGAAKFWAEGLEQMFDSREKFLESVADISPVLASLGKMFIPEDAFSPKKPGARTGGGSPSLTDIARPLTDIVRPLVTALGVDLSRMSIEGLKMQKDAPMLDEAKKQTGYQQQIAENTARLLGGGVVPVAQ